MQKITLTTEQDLWYGKYMGDFLTQGLTELKAEKETIKLLIQKFPELSVLKNKKVKIAV